MGTIPPAEPIGRVAQRHPLLWIAASAATGIVIDRVIGPTFGNWHSLPLFIWFVFCGVTIATVVWCRDRLPEANPRGSFARFGVTGRLATVLLFLPLAALAHRLQDNGYDSAGVLPLAQPNEQPAIVVGTVEVPVVLRRQTQAEGSRRRGLSPWQTVIELRLDQLRMGQRWERNDGRLLVVLEGRLDSLRPGDLLRIYGTMRRFPPPTNPGERDLRDFYRRRGLHARVDVDSTDQIVRIGASGRGLRRLVASIASTSRECLLQHTSESAGPLAVALVIGQRDFVDRDTRDMLLITGTAHLLSVSGLHLAIIVLLAQWAAALMRLPLPAKVGWVLSICLLYTAITGARPPVVRASVLVGTFLFATWMRRPSRPLNTLALAAIILMVVNPNLVFSIGVQLSFLAVATLLLCGHHPSDHGSFALQQTIRREQRLEALVRQSRSPIYQRFEWLIATVAQMTWFSACVTAISTPLIWYHFHVVSVISVAANVVLGPLMFVALASGVATVIGGNLFDPLAIVPGWICSTALALMRRVIESAASFSWGHFWLPAPPLWCVMMFYVVMVLTLLLAPGRRSSFVRYVWIAVWMAMAWTLALRTPPLEEGSIEATFVDVGHGTSVVLRLGPDEVWLYDCGRMGNDTHSSRGIDVTLWELGVTRLRGIILSHADTDHFNALPGLVRRFEVDEIITPPGMLREPEPALVAIEKSISRAGIPVRELSRGMMLGDSGAVAQVLHPPRRRIVGSDNANSLVLRIDAGGKSLVLPGDLEPPGTRWLIEIRRPAPGGVLMAPHHGSIGMDARSVLQWSRPRETIVSGGRRAQRPEVAEMLSVTGSGVHVTRDRGAIRVWIDRDGDVEVRGWTENPW